MGAAQAVSADAIAQATAGALALRDAITDANAGVASLTTQLLPELFPTPDKTLLR